ncbi:MAG: PorP/SprF family type IX secretion system membrane protein [Bacteroidales bacterium]|nr:PorP/SprF family type IX secretion system membrane protein [Bacteroidales bacterium]
MKKLVIISILTVLAVTLKAQQAPLSESYFMDKYTLAPSYAGNFSPKFLFLGYRSDWSGVAGGPMTFRLSYNDVLMQNAGYGAKIVYDKAGIFNQLFVLGSYSYNLNVSGEHHVLFGISAGLYHNSLNLLDYYNDPNYNIDPALVQDDVKSKVKFMSNISLVYAFKDFEAGVVLSNISFGDATYKVAEDLKYNPVSVFQVHASYLINVAEGWDITPFALVRGGKDIKPQVEIASQVMWQKKIMGSLVFRDPGILGIGLGAYIDKGLRIGYNFNFATNVAMNIYNNHEVTVGFNIFEYVGKKDAPMVE